MWLYLERALVPFKKKGVLGVFLKPQNKHNAQHLWKQTIVQKIPS